MPPAGVLEGEGGQALGEKGVVGPGGVLEEGALTVLAALVMSRLQGLDRA